METEKKEERLGTRIERANQALEILVADFQNHHIYVEDFDPETIRKLRRFLEDD